MVNDSDPIEVIQRRTHLLKTSALINPVFFGMSIDEINAWFEDWRKIDPHRIAVLLSALQQLMAELAPIWINCLVLVPTWYMDENLFRCSLCSAVPLFIRYADGRMEYISTELVRQRSFDWKDPMSHIWEWWLRSDDALMYHSLHADQIPITLLDPRWVSPEAFMRERAMTPAQLNDLITSEGLVAYHLHPINGVSQASAAIISQKGLNACRFRKTDVDALGLPKADERYLRDKQMLYGYADKLRNGQPDILIAEIARRAEKALKGKWPSFSGEEKTRRGPQLRSIRQWLRKKGY